MIVGPTTLYPLEGAARAKLGSLLLAINSSAAPRTPPTVAQLIERFIAAEHLALDPPMASAPRRLHYATIRGYLTILNRYLRPRWGDMELTYVRPAAVQAWLDSLGVAPKTKAHIRGLLRRLFEKAMAWDMLDLGRNPIELVELKGVTKRQKLPTILSEEQFRYIVERLAEPCRTMAIVAQCTGLRISEILGLQWRDIDLTELTLTVTRALVNGRLDEVKTEYSQDLLPLDQSLADVLRHWQAASCPTPEGWVFANPATKRPLYACSLAKRHLRPIGRALGLRIGWHTFRHTYRSWLDQSGVPVGVQQKLMRHANVATTMNVYGNALMAAKRVANGKVVRLAIPESNSVLTAQDIDHQGEERQPDCAG